MARPRRSRQFGCVATATLIATVLTGCSSSSTRTPTSTSSTLPPGRTAPTDLPASCTSRPKLAPDSPTPTWPPGYRILDAVPRALSAQYPSVFGGVVVAHARSGEPMVEVNSHLVVLETVRDPRLEAEVRSAYPSGIVVTFARTPRSEDCLDVVNARVGSQWGAAAKSGVIVESSGIGRSQVVVAVSACTAPTEQKAREWFSRRWGGAVAVTTCQKPAVATPATVR